MTSAQYREALEKLGLNQKQAAVFLGLSLRTSARYALDEYPVPEAIAKLLRLMVELNLKPSDVK